VCLHSLLNPYYNPETSALSALHIRAGGPEFMDLKIAESVDSI